jgi:acetylornithine/N-succinyldiaminopimelate aminotransferase
MNLFDVYPRYDIEPVRGEGSFIWDSNGTKYLDLYGGHAVISVGHSHPHYISTIYDQLKELAFYSNFVKMSMQERLAERLGILSGYDEYGLFLCNSGAEAIENALKVASFHTGRKKIIVFTNGFHGRTSLAVEATDNEKIQAPINYTGNIIRIPLNDVEAFEQHLDDSIAAVLIEGIQGISGVYEPELEFLQLIEQKCKENGSLFIADEIQSGYGRSGKFFAHQHADVRPDIITIAKGMGNGFPIGGILISPSIPAWSGMLGTTFGGTHLACAAALAVLEIIEQENLASNAKNLGDYFIQQLSTFDEVIEVRGKGLMIGVEFPFEIKELRKRLIFDHQIFTGSSSNPNTLRLLPPLSVKKDEVDYFLSALKKALKS